MAVGIRLPARAVGRVRHQHEGRHGQIVNLGLSLMPMSELTIEDTWHMAGMKGTGSNTIVAKDVFVPEHRFLPYPPAFEGTYRTEHIERGGLPRRVRSDHGADSRRRAARRRAGGARLRRSSKAGARGVTHTNFPTQSESAGFQMLLADAAMKIETAVLHAYRARRRSRPLRPVADAIRMSTARARMRIDTALVAKYCRDAVDQLVSAHGTSSLADVSPMQRLWRDIHVASHHAITEWQVNLEVYGKALLGQENITHLL